VLNAYKADNIQDKSTGSHENELRSLDDSKSQQNSLSVKNQEDRFKSDSSNQNRDVGISAMGASIGSKV
jgi:hypothetical protein